MTYTSAKNESALENFEWFDPQRVVFVAFFVSGSLGVIGIKEFGLGPITAIVFSALVMAAYIFYCGTGKTDMRPEILGDNIYYMGFLFTLVSLAYTLYKFTSSDNEIDQIIKNFGIALTTTLIGVIGRVYFNQTREEEAEETVLTQQFEDKETEIARQKINAMRAQLASEIESCQSLVIHQSSALTESIRGTGEALLALTRQIDSVSKATHSISQSLIEERQRYIAHVEKESLAFKTLNESIQSDAAQSATALEALQSGLDRLSASGNHNR